MLSVHPEMVAMRPIPLTNSDMVAWVSDEDYPKISLHRWFLKPSAWCSYVCRSVKVGDKVRTERLHRVIAQRILGDIPLPKNMDVHHGPDENPLNNTRENLRVLEHDIHGSVTRQHNSITV